MVLSALSINAVIKNHRRLFILFSFSLVLGEISSWKFDNEHFIEALPILVEAGQLKRRFRVNSIYPAIKSTDT